MSIETLNAYKNLVMITVHASNLFESGLVMVMSLKKSQNKNSDEKNEYIVIIKQQISIQKLKACL